MLFRSLKEISNLFFPTTCLNCSNNLNNSEYLLCLTCEHQLPYTEYSNFENNSFEKNLRGRIPIQAATTLLYFRKSGITQKLIHQLKYHGVQKIGTYFAEKLANEIKQSNRFNSLDGIIVVPLHPNKLKMRGYNQLTTFAEKLSQEMEIPIIDEVLIKINQSESQTKKNRFNRFDKMNEKFQIKNVEKIRGLHILLVDDVLTTGATLEACANELLKGDNVRLSLATMAIPYN